MRLVAAALWAAAIARAAAQPAGYFFVDVTSSVMMQNDERRPWRPWMGYVNWAEVRLRSRRRPAVQQQRLTGQY